MNWFMPAFVSRSPDSGGGISDDERTRVWPRSSKNERNVSRILSPSIRGWSLAVVCRRLGDISPCADAPHARGRSGSGGTVTRGLRVTLL